MLNSLGVKSFYKNPQFLKEVFGIYPSSKKVLEEVKEDIGDIDDID